jgi:hypothetical protein
MPVHSASLSATDPLWQPFHTSREEVLTNLANCQHGWAFAVSSSEICFSGYPLAETPVSSVMKIALWTQQRALWGRVTSCSDNCLIKYRSSPEENRLEPKITPTKQRGCSGPAGDSCATRSPGIREGINRFRGQAIRLNINCDHLSGHAFGIQDS